MSNLSNSYTMLSMMGQGAAGTSQVPTQTFNGANILGTPVPVVGDQKGNPPYAGNVGGVNSSHIVVIALLIIVGGYLAFHLNFEK